MNWIDVFFWIRGAITFIGCGYIIFFIVKEWLEWREWNRIHNRPFGRK